MDSRRVKAVVDWMKDTDLVEISYRKGAAGFSLSAGAPAAPPAAPSMTEGRFAAVVAEAVGVFQWSLPGRPRRAEPGALVAEGDALGVVIGAGEPKPVKAPRSGRVAKLFVEAGQTVEYGQPVLLLETR